MFDQWACSFFAGSLADWVGAIGTAGGTLLAAWALWHEFARRERERREADYTAAVVLSPLFLEIASALGEGLRFPPAPERISIAIAGLAPGGPLRTQLERHTAELAETLSLPLRARLLHVNRMLATLSRIGEFGQAPTMADAIEIANEMQDRDSDFFKQWVASETALHQLYDETKWVEFKVERNLSKAMRPNGY